MLFDRQYFTVLGTILALVFSHRIAVFDVVLATAFIKVVAMFIVIVLVC